MKWSRKTSQGRSGWVECDISTEWREGEAMQIPKERTFQAEAVESAKALRPKQAQSVLVSERALEHTVSLQDGAQRNDPRGECGNEVCEIAQVQMGYLLSGQGKGL